MRDRHLSRRIRVRAKLARQRPIRYMTNRCKSVNRAYNFGPKSRRRGPGAWAEGHWGRAAWA